MIKSFRAFGACITWVVLFGLYAILLKAWPSGGILAAMNVGFSGDIISGGIAVTAIDYLSQFHVLTNIFVGLAFTAPLLKSGNKLRRFFEIQAVRAAIALYITVVVVPYTVLLPFIAPLYTLLGMHTAVFIVLQNLVIPLLYIFDWLFIAPKDKMSYKRIPYWFIFPFIFGVYTIIRDGITGAYPHPFLYLTERGIGAIFVIMLGCAAFYAIGGAVFIALGRRLGRNSTAANATN